MNEDILEAIDNAAIEDKKEKEDVDNIRKELKNIYRKHNPSKLGDIDGLLQKYKGKEVALLNKVRTKYNPTDDRESWSFVLKRYEEIKHDPSRAKKANWKIDESLGDGPKTEVIEATVTQMRDVVHNRYRNKSNAHMLTNEHEKRKAEKKKNQQKRGGRNPKRR
ncbi:MAG: hypothetical protein SGARI_001079 [Bacillariaceae sp.]